MLASQVRVFMEGKWREVEVVSGDDSSVFFVDIFNFFIYLFFVKKMSESILIK
jgi:hypothetical protein